ETFLRISRSDGGDFYGSTTNFYEVGVSDGANFYDSALFPMPDGDIGNWVHLAGTYDGSSWNLYRNGSLVASVAPSAGDTGALDTTNRWSIGSRTSPSPTPPSAALDADQAFAAEGIFFGGSIDEPAIFSTALAALDINTIYNSAQVSPVITRTPQVPAQPAAAVGTLYSGSSASFSVWAEGSPTLGYLWT